MKQRNQRRGARFCWDCARFFGSWVRRTDRAGKRGAKGRGAFERTGLFPRRQTFGAHGPQVAHSPVHLPGGVWGGRPITGWRGEGGPITGQEATRAGQSQGRGQGDGRGRYYRQTNEHPALHKAWTQMLQKPLPTRLLDNSARKPLPVLSPQAQLINTREVGLRGIGSSASALYIPKDQVFKNY